MRELISIFAMLSIAITSSAQSTEEEYNISDVGSSHAMDILDGYKDMLPLFHLSDTHSPIEYWRPTIGLMPQRLPGTNHLLWIKTEMQKRVNIEPPKFLDYNSITLRLGGGSSSITISNGSAYNHMPWPGSPAAYRDARTLSFPVPR